MQLFLLGATGRTGGNILDLALAHGHSVTAFVRSPNKLTPRERLRVVAGSPLNTEQLREAMRGHDAVLSALGAGFRDALRPSTLMTDCATATVAAMEAAAVPRLSIVSAAVLFPGKGLQFKFFKWFLRHHARDLVGMESRVTTSPLAWTVVRPPRLVQSSDASYRIARDALPDGSMVASFSATAAFMLDAVETHTHVREVIGLAR